MTSYAVFLRGINVGGINIKMADLRQALQDCPFTGVKTLLASGNVVLASELEPAAVKDVFEACLRDSFGYDAWVVVLTADHLTNFSTPPRRLTVSSRQGWGLKRQHGWLRLEERWKAPSANSPPSPSTRPRRPHGTSAP